MKEKQKCTIAEILGTLVVLVLLFVTFIWGLNFYDYQQSRKTLGPERIYECQRQTMQYPQLCKSLIAKLEDGMLSRQEYDDFMGECSVTAARETYIKLLKQEGYGR